MKNTKRLDFTVLIFACILIVFSSSCVWAQTVDEYAEILKSGKYALVYSIEGSVKGTAYEKSTSVVDMVIAEDKARDLSYYELDGRYSNIEAPYSLQKYFSAQGSAFYSLKVGKKPFKKETIKMQNLKLGTTSAEFMLPGLESLKIMAKEHLFSSLGGIAQTASILPKYNAVLVQRGTEKINGRELEFLEYHVTVPKEEVLRLYFLQDQLVKVIKIMNNSVSSHVFFDNIDITKHGYCVINIKRFDGHPEDIFNKLMQENRINKE